MKKTLTILVADDDATHREVLRTLLEEWGYAVREAVDGEHAVALCREQPFDLVLMDVRMPKKSGLEALKEIKVHNPAVPVLIMTAFSDVAAAVEAIAPVAAPDLDVIRAADQEARAFVRSYFRF